MKQQNWKDFEVLICRCGWSTSFFLDCARLLDQLDFPVFKEKKKTKINEGIEKVFWRWRMITISVFVCLPYASYSMHFILTSFDHNSHILAFFKLPVITKYSPFLSFRPTQFTLQFKNSLKSSNLTKLLVIFSSSIVLDQKEPTFLPLLGSI